MRCGPCTVYYPLWGSGIHRDNIMQWRLTGIGCCSSIGVGDDAIPVIGDRDRVTAVKAARIACIINPSEVT